MSRSPLAVLIACPALVAALGVGADSTATIGSSAAGYSGVLMLNQAAGELHQQVNARAVSPGTDPSIRVEQQLGALPQALGADDMRAGIHARRYSWQCLQWRLRGPGGEPGGWSSQSTDQQLSGGCGSAPREPGRQRSGTGHRGFVLPVSCRAARGGGASGRDR